MAEDKKLPEETLTGLDKLQHTYETNSNAINIGLILILLAVSGLLYYLKVAQPKAEIAAQEAIFQAQYHFERDEFQEALNSGLIETGKKYSSTKAGKLANYYAGISYFHLGDFNSAVFYLGKFKTNNDLLKALSTSALADAQMEIGDVSGALKNYKLSAAATKNEAIAPVVLFKAALAHETQGKIDEAIKLYTELKDKYPSSDQANDAEKYLSRANAKL
jgi:TolA-binding protein